MELRQIRQFLAVVDAGTLAAAARSLGLTQQAISAGVAGLEKNLGQRLLDRGPGGITRLTPYGEALVPFARSQMEGDRRAREAIDAIANAERGTVTIGIGETFSGEIIAAAVTRLYEDRPGVRINMVEGYSEQLLDRFYQGDFDFVAVGISGVTLADGFAPESIYTADDVVACRPGHPLLDVADLQLADLEGYGWLVPFSRPSDQNVICDAFVAAGCAPPTRFIGSDAFRLGMKVLTTSDLLIMSPPALVQNRFVHAAHGIETLPISEPTVRRYASIVTDTKRPLTPAAKQLLEHVREQAKVSPFIHAA